MFKVVLVDEFRESRVYEITRLWPDDDDLGAVDRIGADDASIRTEGYEHIVDAISPLEVKCNGKWIKTIGDSPLGNGLFDDIHDFRVTEVRGEQGQSSRS